jgi:hypothetical protein
LIVEEKTTGLYYSRFVNNRKEQVAFYLIVAVATRAKHVDLVLLDRALKGHFIVDATNG